jgi:hypothetical protein
LNGSKKIVKTKNAEGRFLFSIGEYHPAQGNQLMRRSQEEGKG